MNLVEGQRLDRCRLQDGLDKNPIRDGDQILRLGCSGVLGWGLSARMPNSPSFRARPRALAFPPSSTTLSHLLLPSLFPPSLSSLPPQSFPSAAPPFFPPPLIASPSGDGSPAHILPSSHGASPRLAGPGPEDCTAPQPSVATLAGTDASSSGSSPGSPGDHVQEVLESMHQLVSVPSKNTHGSLGFPEFRITAAQTDD